MREIKTFARTGTLAARSRPARSFTSPHPLSKRGGPPDTMGAAESHTAKKQVNVDEAKEFFSAKLVVGGDDKPETLLPISYWKEASEDEEATATFAYYCAVGRRVLSLAPSTTPRRRRRGETRPARRNRASSSRSSAPC